MKPELLELVPHARPMLLLDRYLEVDHTHALAEVDVHRGALFAGDDGIESWVGIEYMAQTVALIAGWRAWRRGEKVRVGYLLGTRRYQPAAPLFRHGSRLLIGAREEWMSDEGMARFDCTLSCDNGASLLAAAGLTLYQPPDAPPVAPAGV